jgi:hypothetical protein
MQKFPPIREIKVGRHAVWAGLFLAAAGHNAWLSALVHPGE